MVDGCVGADGCHDEGHVRHKRLLT
jgi:hypothetical protein